MSLDIPPGRTIGLQPFRASTGLPDRQWRVLVAEDDPVQALLLTLLLDRLNVASTLVRDGAEALEAVRRERYAVVLMDYLMPGLDGVEATRRIRTWESAQGVARVPIVAVTASAMAEECRRYLGAGMDDVLLKPFTAQQLEATLVRHAAPAGPLQLCLLPGREAGLSSRRSEP